MNRLGVVVAILGVAAAACAAPDKARMDAIWSYADARMDQQMDVWFEDGDFPSSIAMLRVTAEGRPGDYDTWTNLGWMLENIEDWSGAEGIYLRYSRENTKDPDGNLPLAEYYFRRKKYDPIPALLTEKLKMSPKPHPNCFRILAHTYERTGRLAESEKVWKSYIATAPEDLTAQNNLRRVQKKLAQHGL